MNNAAALNEADCEALARLAVWQSHHPSEREIPEEFEATVRRAKAITTGISASEQRLLNQRILAAMVRLGLKMDIDGALLTGMVR